MNQNKTGKNKHLTYDQWCTILEEILFLNTRGPIEEALGKLVEENSIQIIQRGKYILYYRK